MGWTWGSSDNYQIALILSSIEYDLHVLWSVQVVMLLLLAAMLLLMFLRGTSR